MWKPQKLNRTMVIWEVVCDIALPKLKWLWVKTIPFSLSMWSWSAAGSWRSTHSRMSPFRFGLTGVFSFETNLVSKVVARPIWHLRGGAISAALWTALAYCSAFDQIFLYQVSMSSDISEWWFHSGVFLGFGHGNILGLRHVGTLHGLLKSLRNTLMTAWSEKQDQSSWIWVKTLVRGWYTIVSHSWLMEGCSPSHLVIIGFDPQPNDGH